MMTTGLIIINGVAGGTSQRSPPSRLGLQLGARMRRHADCSSEWNSLFTNLPAAGRLGVDRRSGQDCLRGKATLLADGSARKSRAAVARLRCVDAGRLVS